ncbi:mitochondrial ribosomal protein L23, putative [Talaromyces stipitatus ATCC 10500]|uniref:Large ribosomal subunit protein uL23m n=1 Tax=Talaromyces stipitatus (strain ATCC 10500 / CBS 375.48 / QM 6759 / NRRL 1006) TaxID=441959 RepID=B8LY30_TALSN|nr:mitochondrial 54S ribosomal protein YmL41 [Talaromyces stipitatus ATCC 10500]EED23275.1 mitochondrial ribosomal protein L23, putative [Talaromyces stipitatus ATCC 10500]
MTRVRRLAKKPIFLPEFVVTLVRTPFLPPRYATFYVPLEFNKLDMREYMKQVYNVDIISIRSFVEQQKVTREFRDGRPGYGPIRRPKSKKKMTIEMTEPFVWPEVPKDLSPWQPDQFYRHREYSQEFQESGQPSASAKPLKGESDAFAEQAKELLEGKTAWKPTWQALGLRYDRPALAKLSEKTTLEAKVSQLKTTKEGQEAPVPDVKVEESSQSVESTPKDKTS